jgi:hypothetical protein
MEAGVAGGAFRRGDRSYRANRPGTYSWVKMSRFCRSRPITTSLRLGIHTRSVPGEGGPAKLGGAPPEGSGTKPAGGRT